MNILVIKHGSLGDLVLSFGAIKTLRHNYPNSKISLLTQSNYKNIFNQVPFVDEIFIDNRLGIIKSIFNYLSILKANKINLVFDLQNSSRTQIYHLFTRLFSNSEILSSRRFSTFEYQQQPLGFQHITQNHRDQLKKLGIQDYYLPDLSWMCKNNNNHRNYIIIIPGASITGSYKKWPVEKFAEIAQYFVDKKFEVYLTGSKLDLNDINKIIELCPAAQNKINESKIEDFFELCLGSSLIVSNDTGPAHIAGLSNKHMIWLANDNRISKSCYPLGKNVHKIFAENVKTIKTTQVKEKIDQLI